MRKGVAVLVLSVAVLCHAQKKATPVPQGELDAVSSRGSVLAAYDWVVWHGTDAVMELKPDPKKAPRFIARREDKDWVVVFGSINQTKDTFLIYYKAVLKENTKKFEVSTLEPPVEDKGFFLAAANAIELTSKDFERNTPYNVAVLEADNHQFLVVYWYPALLDLSVYRLGGDYRYFVSSDGTAITEKDQLHKSILEYKDSKDTVATVHTHVLIDEPVETDVAFALYKHQSVMVGCRSGMYAIDPDGSIRVVKK